MMSGVKPFLRCVSLSVSALMVPGIALAGGPLGTNPNDPDFVERWPNGGQDIPFNPDGVPAGGAESLALGPWSYTRAVAETVAAFEAWGSIPSATGTYKNNGPLPFDVDATNFAPFIQNLFFGANNSDGLSPIVYDADGSIFVALFGVSGVLGFASPDTRDANGIPIEAVAFLNGGSMNDGFPEADFIGVIVHEFGHYSGMGHTVVNGQNAILGDSSGPSPLDTYGVTPLNQIETMYPFAVVGAETSSLHADDVGFYSFLYPSADVFATSGTIQGTIRAPTGAGITGVNVIARNVENPFVDAVSAISGDRGTPGAYTINGLTPGAVYTVHVDQILDGGFSTTPITLPGPEEFYNGENESNNVISTDDPAEATPVVVAAGVPTTGIDIIFNGAGPGQGLPLNDDDSIELFLPFTFTMCGQSFGSVFVNSNGSITFGAGDIAFAESPVAHLAGPPRIAGLWDDFNPSAGGRVTFDSTSDSFSIFFESVPEFFNTGANSFEIELFADNHFEIAYGAMSAADGLAGFSCGGFVTSGLEPSVDLTETSLSLPSAAIYEVLTDENDLVFETLVFGPTSIPADAFEPNNTVATATPVTLPFFETDEQFASIAPVGADVDYYSFSASVGSTLLAEVTGGQLDSLIGLFLVDDEGLTPVAVDDDGGAGVLSRLAVTLPASGTYVLAVTTFGDADFSGGGLSGGRYVLQVQEITGSILALGDDTSVEVPLGFDFPFQGQVYSSVFVNSNGNLTFGTGDTSFAESVTSFLSGPPRIAPLWDDLSPNQGGLVYVDSSPSEVSIVFQGVPEFFSATGNTFKVVLTPTGDVELSYDGMSAQDGLVGLTEGNEADDTPTDFSLVAGAGSAVGTTFEVFTLTNPFDLDLSFLNFEVP